MSVVSLVSGCASYSRERFLLPMQGLSGMSAECLRFSGLSTLAGLEFQSLSVLYNLCYLLSMSRLFARLCEVPSCTWRVKTLATELCWTSMWAPRPTPLCSSSVYLSLMISWPPKLSTKVGWNCSHCLFSPMRLPFYSSSTSLHPGKKVPPFTEPGRRWQSSPVLLFSQG